MNIANMHVGFKQEVDKTSALELPSFEPEEIDLWLTNAIKRFGKLRYKEFEKSQKRIDDLRTLIKHYSDVSSVAGDYTNGYAFQLPIAGSGVGDEDYWFALSEECSAVVSGGATRFGVTECTIDEYRSKIDDPYSEHILHYNTAKPLRIFNNNSVELISDGTYTVSAYYLTYLRKPAEVSLSGAVDCDLPEHTHDEIVKLAASMALENIEQPRYQTHMNEVITME
jgi:hypothetical protein